MSLNEDDISELISVIEAVAHSDSDFLVDKLINLINRLRLKYGDLPILLSTKADFVEPLDLRLELYKQSIALSDAPTEYYYIIQSAEAITEIYIQDLKDYENGKHWLEKLKYYVELYGDDYTIHSLSELQAELNRLLFRVVK